MRPKNYKICNKCSKKVKVYVSCFGCHNTYHAKCLLKVVNRYINENGQAFCCRDITSKRRPIKTGLEPQTAARESLGVKIEYENDSERFEYKCKTRSLGFESKNPLIDHHKTYKEDELPEEHSNRDVRSRLSKNEDIKLDVMNTELKCSYRNCECAETGRAQGNSCRCGPCEYKTVRVRNLKCHILMRHTRRGEAHAPKHVKEKPFKCGKCDFTTIYKRSLRPHMQAMHDEESYKRPFKCSTCEYATTRRGHLETHMFVRHRDKLPRELQILQS